MLQGGLFDPNGHEVQCFQFGSMMNVQSINTINMQHFQNTKLGALSNEILKSFIIQGNLVKL